MAKLGVLDRPAEPRSAAKDKAAEVLMTAADLMYHNGFDATSMKDIAKAVNLTKAGLYYYTKGKHDLQATFAPAAPALPQSLQGDHGIAQHKGRYGGGRAAGVH